MNTPAAAAPLLDAIFRSNPDGVVVVDDEGKIVFANDRCRDLLGFEPSELVGRDIEMLVPAQHGRHAEMRAAYQREPVTRAMGKRPVLRILHKSGTTVPVDIALSPLPPFEGSGRLVQAVIRDATPRWSVQEDLLVQSVAMNAAANGIVITDRRGVIEWVNPAVTHMTGYTSDELIGRHTRLLKSEHHNREFYQQLWATVLAGRTWFGEMANRRKDGTIYFEEQHIAPVLDENGHVARFIAIKQDVTARRRAEQALQEANEELTRRLAEIGALHQQLQQQSIRDPLTNLFNRRYLDETLQREVIRAKRNTLDLSAILIDVDAFKQVNDTAGHAAGDAILTSLAALLMAHVRESDVACRLGGDEFIVLLPGASLAVGEQRAVALGQAFAESQHAMPGGPSACTLSMGVTHLRTGGDSADTFLRRADAALYRAKQEGRDRVIAIL